MSDKLREAFYMKDLVSFTVPVVAGFLLGYSVNGNIYSQHRDLLSIAKQDARSNPNHPEFWTSSNLVTLFGTHAAAWFVSCCFGSYISSIPLIGLGEYAGYQYRQQNRSWTDSASEQGSRAKNSFLSLFQ